MLQFFTLTSLIHCIHELMHISNIGEKQRILSAGGRVFAVEYEDGQDGPQRVWLGHMDVPGLAMSRSLGDKVSVIANIHA
jgi:hypothetical protein